MGSKNLGQLRNMNTVKKTGPLRNSPELAPSIKNARVLKSAKANLLNIWCGGALLETAERIMPGASVCLRLVAPDAVFLLRGRILRSRASCLRSQGVLHESIVEFETGLPSLLRQGNANRTAGKDAQTASRRLHIIGGRKTGSSSKGLAQNVFTVTACIPRPDSDLRQILKSHHR